jgi:hypothetical protein
MKINLEKLDLVVDLMMNQILGECEGFKECNKVVEEENVDECDAKILHGSKVSEEEVNELENIDEELEDVDEQVVNPATAQKIAAITKNLIARGKDPKLAQVLAKRFGGATKATF